ncbi:MAG: thioredoxin domain-containing protein [Terracidiphilus sp.]|jgi:protein-disulfide isomerase
MLKSMVYLPLHFAGPLRFVRSQARIGQIRSLVLAAAIALIAPAFSAAQYGPSPATKVLDASPLKPPPGVRVAIFEFADLECPACAAANPVLKQAAAQYKIPWLRHDFIIPNHVWSTQAAVNARWFDTQVKGLGDQYRDQVFANQQSIETRADLERFTEKFAQYCKVSLPFSMDPQNKLMGEVQADVALGKRVGVARTPTIFIVVDTANGPRYFESHDPKTDLYQTIDQAMAVARPVPARTARK